MVMSSKEATTFNYLLRMLTRIIRVDRVITTVDHRAKIGEPIMTARVLGRWLCETEAPIPDAPSDVISALVMGSATIFDACRDASDVADRERRTVVFDYDKTRVIVKPDEDYRAIARGWIRPSGRKG